MVEKTLQSFWLEILGLNVRMIGASSGRAGAMGETTGHAAGHTSFLGPRFGRFVPGSLFLGVF